jgi:hypothetical protein
LPVLTLIGLTAGTLTIQDIYCQDSRFRITARSLTTRHSCQAYTPGLPLRGMSARQQIVKKNCKTKLSVSQHEAYLPGIKLLRKIGNNLLRKTARQNRKASPLRDVSARPFNTMLTARGFSHFPVYSSVGRTAPPLTTGRYYCQATYKQALLPGTYKQALLPGHFLQGITARPLPTGHYCQAYCQPILC